MTVQAIACPACGTRIRADRDRCPRCRERFVKPDPTTDARQSQLLRRWAAGLAAACLLGLAGLWMARDPEPVALATTVTADPLAARRQANAASAADALDNTAPARPAAGTRPFVEAAGEGAIAYSAGEYSQALEKFQQAVDRNADDAESLSNLAQVLVRQGRTAEALPYYARAIAIIPDRWAYRFNLARALGLLGRWDESIAAYRDARHLFPDDYVTSFNLALALHKKGDDAAAVEEYRRAISLQPEDASFHFALALSYERLKRAPEAAGAYEEYLRLAPSAADADQVRARISQLTGVR